MKQAMIFAILGLALTACAERPADPTEGVDLGRAAVDDAGNVTVDNYCAVCIEDGDMDDGPIVAGWWPSGSGPSGGGWICTVHSDGNYCWKP